MMAHQKFLLMLSCLWICGLHLWVVRAAAAADLRDGGSRGGAGQGFLVVSPPHFGAGLTNQLTVVAKALIIGNLMKRRTIVHTFNIHYSGNVTVPLGEVLDIAATNEALRDILEFTDLYSREINSELCFHSTAVLDVQCSMDTTEQIAVSDHISIDSTVLKHALAHEVARLGLSSWLVYIWPGIEESTAIVLSALRFKPVFYRAAESILRRSAIGSSGKPNDFTDIDIDTDTEPEAVRKQEPCELAGRPYGVVHLRFEKDFLDYLHAGQQRQPLASSALDASLDQHLLDTFITRTSRFLSPDIIKTIYVCASEGKLVSIGINKLRDLYDNVIVGPKLGLLRLETDTLTKAVSIVMNKSRKASSYPASSNSVSAFTPATAVNARELYALMDFIIAVRSARFIGVAGSSFSKCVAQLRRCNRCSANNSSVLWNPKVTGKKLANRLNKNKTQGTLSDMPPRPVQKTKYEKLKSVRVN
jgi:hypothetical protein